MPEAEGFDGALGLTDFLSDLRAELAEASARAEDDPLKLGVEEVTVSLDVGVTIEKKGVASASGKARFWIFASVEGTASSELSSRRVTTHHMTLTLKPRIETVVSDSEGRQTRATRGVDVVGGFDAQEERPRIPGPPTRS